MRATRCTHSTCWPAYLSNLPGRKNLIWFSGSFPISILPDPSLKNPFVVAGAGGKMNSGKRSTFWRGARLPCIPDRRAEDSRKSRQWMPVTSAPACRGALETSPGTTATSSAQTAGEQSTMNQMARGTGGEAFVNTNGLKRAIEKAIATGSRLLTRLPIRRRTTT